ncbi:hypothetical protein CWS72_05370 [Telmatospirillum siberiense]|uniref:Uncharacterized protein n=1 Tax=Telmatospirillum siberiense TaxID=382514 RepID=A0A2N3PYK9_9PROT|nr:hypothetical protein CWS72_05370 [Telmatospirillum siberiense]
MVTALRNEGVVVASERKGDSRSLDVALWPLTPSSWLPMALPRSATSLTVVFLLLAAPPLRMELPSELRKAPVVGTLDAASDIFANPG